MTTGLQEQVRQQLLAGLGAPISDGIGQLNTSLRLVAKWRSVLIQNTVLQQMGTRVWQGPLQGLDFWEHSAEGCHVAKLLGCYEQPLQPAVERAIAAPYEVVLNIGCAEGYYAVGMARRMRTARVLAFDLDPKAQATCTALASKNAVADRVTVGGLFQPADFAAFDRQQTLVFCDIEGAEGELLDPLVAPALRFMDLIVESHEGLKPGMTALLIERFKASHDVELIQDNGQRQLDNAPAWFYQLAHLDQLLATWEWRSGPTPWLVMKARQPNA